MPLGSNRNHCKDCNKEISKTSLRCHSCALKGNKNSQSKNGLSKTKDYVMDKTLQRRYKITLKEYNSLKNKQNNCCYICNKKDIKLALDHNHKTHRNRKFLCYSCNNLVKDFEIFLHLQKDDKILFTKIMSYIERE